MESVGFTFNDLYFVIHPFEFSSMYGVIAVVENTVAITRQSPDKGIDRTVV